MEQDLDKDLYNKYLNGDKTAFDKLYLKYKDKLKYFVFNIVKDYEKADDIVQEVFMYVLNNNYDNNKSFKYYLYLIAKSKSINYLNKENRRNKITEIYIENAEDKNEKEILENVLKKETKDSILEAITELNEKYKETMYLTKIEEFSYQETANILKISLQDVKNNVHRGKKELKRILIKKGFGDMNRVTKTLILCAVFLVVAVPVGVIASKQLIQYDEQGRVIVYAGSKKPDLPDGTPIVLAIPVETEEQKSERLRKEEENAILEKKQFEAKVRNNEIEKFNTSITPEEKEQIDNIIAENNQREEDVINILKKYYGEEKIDTLFKTLRDTTESSTIHKISEYKISEAGIELIRLMFGIIDSETSTIEEKEKISELLKGIDSIGIKTDEALKNRLDELKEK